MPTVHLSPIGNDTAFYAQGEALSGGFLYAYAAGTTTQQTTYTTSDGTVANANPLVLNSEGYPSAGAARVELWLVEGLSYKFVLKNADGATLWSMDDIDGINDFVTSAVEWVSVAQDPVTGNPAVPAKLSATVFTLVGDHTTDALPDRRVKITAGATITYSTVFSAVFANPFTTVTISGTTEVTDGVTKVEWGLLRPDNPSIPVFGGDLKAPVAVTAAATTPLWTAGGNLVHVAGTGATVTSFGTARRAGEVVDVIWDSAGNTITHHATTLKIPGGVNVVTGAGDRMRVAADTTANANILSYVSTISALPAGMIMDFGGSTVPTGWLECDGSEASRTTYALLFAAIGSNFGVGDGTLTFNLPDFRGRARIGKGTGDFVSRFTNADINVGTDVFTVPVNTTLITGTQVVYHAVTTPATNMTNDATYFVIRLTSTTIQLATTLALAQNGTSDVNPTGAGSGQMTFTVTLTARSIGQEGGEETHAISSTEALAHTHVVDLGDSSGGGSRPPKLGLNNDTDGVSGSFGGNVAMNNMQPFGVTMAIIRTGL